MFLLTLGLLVRWVQIATATLLAVYLASLHSFFPASDTIPIHIGHRSADIGHRSNASENCPVCLRNHCPISIGIGVRYGLEQVSDLNRNRCPICVGIRSLLLAQLLIVLAMKM